MKWNQLLLKYAWAGQSTIDDSHPGEEGYVRRSSDLSIKQNTDICKKRQTFYYMAIKKHYLQNLGNSVARILWISTPPMF